MLLHYLVQLETLKMHVKTNLPFYTNYQVATKCIKLAYFGSFIKCSDKSHI